MELGFVTKDTTTSSWKWVITTLPAFLGSKNLFDPYVLVSIFAVFMSLSIITWYFSFGGVAWKNGRNRIGPVSISGPCGLPIFGSLFDLSRGLAHRSLATMAWTSNATQLMAFSLGLTPVVVASDPITAKEILTSPHFADRPIKQSAKSLMFSRAIGFAPNGAYWRLLRKIASTHLFSPRRILAHEPGRLLDCAVMLRNVAEEQKRKGFVSLRKHLQLASLNNITGSVFGRRYDPDINGAEMEELTEMVNEGFDLLGAFNWSDYLPWVSYFYDPFRINERCSKLVPRVRRFVRGIIEEHRLSYNKPSCDDSDGNFVDVLLSFEGEEKLEVDDMVAVLWEMIFRGTDTTALLTEWLMAELVLHPQVQLKLQEELHNAFQNGHVSNDDVAKLPYLQAVVKETLRIHPPGPLLSWARLSTSDVQLSNGMVIPSNTTAMVNMWAITHDPHVWEDPNQFKPERFLNDADHVDVRGGDLRLAPFGAGRRVCPGKNLGLATVSLWVAELVRGFNWVEYDHNKGIDLSEVLKLSCEMKFPLQVVAVPRMN
ncbi:LOW QUALITY PROTEIN: cytochrome P450 78A7-like [Rutidosis leptorrhynchoides]|uniref:LOW QUALITY PROTEIN: cytochrome P450 78A7-like n=1 Tax=Rutidosis leptorrhynchoides TaxID=125765 RepID=UPI003A9A2693